MIIAVIDIGTNTFNLLIVSVKDTSYDLILKAKESAKLGLGGITNSIITDFAIERGIKALKKFKAIIDNYEVNHILAFPTSALRSAENRDNFISLAKKETGINIKIISGQEEANYIYCGVSRAVPLTEKKVLILDIGGGSNEFIIANKNQVFWKQSFQLGIARVLDKFKPSNPISKEEIETIEQYFIDNLFDLFNEISKHNISTLIGSSGSFDTFQKMTFLNKEVEGSFPKKMFYKITISDFQTLHKKLVESTIEERLEMDGLETMRVEMIHLASILVDVIINKINIKNIIKSSFSLKEGILFDFISNKS